MYSPEHPHDDSRMVSNFDDGIDNYFPSKHPGFNSHKNRGFFTAFGVEGFQSTHSHFFIKLLIFILIVALICCLLNNKH